MLWCVKPTGRATGECCFWGFAESAKGEGWNLGKGVINTINQALKSPRCSRALTRKEGRKEERKEGRKERDRGRREEIIGN